MSPAVGRYSRPVAPRSGLQIVRAFRVECCGSSLRHERGRGCNVWWLFVIQSALMHA
jgi:hypothetical protein